MVGCCVIASAQVSVPDTYYNSCSAAKPGLNPDCKDFISMLKKAGYRLHDGGADKRTVAERISKVAAGKDYEKDCDELNDAAGDINTSAGSGVMPFILSLPDESIQVLPQLKEEKGIEATDMKGFQITTEELSDPGAVIEQIISRLPTGEETLTPFLPKEKDMSENNMLDASFSQIKAGDLHSIQQEAILSDKTDNCQELKKIMLDEAEIGDKEVAELVADKDTLTANKTEETATNVRTGTVIEHEEKAGENTDGKAVVNRIENHREHINPEIDKKDRTPGYSKDNVSENGKRDENDLMIRSKYKWAAGITSDYKTPEGYGNSDEVWNVQNTGIYGKIGENVIKQVMDSIATKARVFIEDDKAELLMNLKPDSLGRLSLKVVAENGIINAKFIAESQQVKEILESGMQVLKDSLEGQGIPVESLSVSVGDGSHGNGWANEGMFKEWKIHNEIKLPPEATESPRYGRDLASLYMGISSNIDLMA